MPKRKPLPKGKSVAAVPALTGTAEFDAVVEMIRAARATAVAAVNTALIDLYWNVGEYLSGKIASGTWGACGSSSTPTPVRKNSQHC